MKVVTIYLGENKIELHNSVWGKETVVVNGSVMSSKFSFTGTEHLFTIVEDEKEVACKLTTGISFNGAVFDLFKDGKPVIESSKSGCMAILFILFIVVGLINLLDKIFN